MKKFGFTLAEVLITLGIIGVVAAVTLPTLVMDAKYKQVGVKLQKFHTNLENAARSYIAANGDICESGVFTCINQGRNRNTQITEFFNSSFDYKNTYNGTTPTNDNYMSGQSNKKNRFRDLASSNGSGYYYGVLKDDTQIAFRSDVFANGHDAEKYGQAVAYVFFSPNIKGLPENAQKTYVFALTSKGLVFPSNSNTNTFVNDPCLRKIYANNYKIDPSDYKSGGVCYNNPTPTPNS